MFEPFLINYLLNNYLLQPELKVFWSSPPHFDLLRNNLKITNLI